MDGFNASNTNSIYLQGFEIEARVPGTLYCEEKQKEFSFGEDLFVQSGALPVEDMLREYAKNNAAS